MTDTNSILDRWFPSRANDRAMRRSMQALVDQVATQNQLLKELADWVSRQESSSAAIESLNDEVRAVHALLDAQANAIRGIRTEFERLDAAVTGARADVRDLASPLATQTRTVHELGDRIESGNERMRHALQEGFNERIAHALAAQQELVKEIGARIDSSNASLPEVVRAPLTQQLAEAQLWLHKISSESQNAFTHLDGAVSGARNDVRDLANPLLQQIFERMDTNNTGLRDAIQGSVTQRIAEAQLWLEKISTENQSALAHLDGGIMGTRGDIGGIANQIAEVRLWLEKISTETTNGLTHLDGRAVTQFNRLFNEALPQVNMQSHVAAALLLDARAQRVDRSRWHASEFERYRKAKEEKFDRTLAKVAADFPSVANPWRERLDEITRAFAITKTGNAANAADMYSQMFKSFVEYHIHGRVLDVGCGVFGRPFYLSEYPAQLISGIEPLPMTEAPDFECVRGISEYLPWGDDSFSTVINATSLDHVASLEKTLAEMFRVLRPGGTLLLWIGATKGSPEFKPDSPQFVPADQFHLFHFDTAWFEPMLAAQWEIINRMEFAMPSFDHVFYALRSRKIS